MVVNWFLTPSQPRRSCSERRQNGDGGLPRSINILYIFLCGEPTPDNAMLTWRISAMYTGNVGPTVHSKVATEELRMGVSA